MKEWQLHPDKGMHRGSLSTARHPPVVSVPVLFLYLQLSGVILKSLTPVFSLVGAQWGVTRGSSQDWIFPGLLQDCTPLHWRAPAQGLVSASHVQRKLWAQGAFMDVLTHENLTFKSCATHTNFERRNTRFYFLNENKCDFRINQ